MKSFLKNFLRKNVYLIVAVLIVFTAAYIINIFLAGNTSTKLLRNSIESFLQEREKEIKNLYADSAFIEKLAEQQYTKSELDELVEKNYGILLYEKKSVNTYSLKFWSDQSSVIHDSLLSRVDGNYFVRLSNGQYELIKRTLIVGNNKPLLFIALIPVRWQYYIEYENLKPEFVGSSSAENRVRITTTTTDFPVRSSFGNILFYLQKTQGYHAAKSSGLLLSTIFIGVLLILALIHNIAHSISEKFGRYTGIIFLIVIILILRGFVYYFPDFLHLRQYELFDPTIYSSNFVLKSLGDLLINALLFCWIVLFIKQEIDEYALPLLNRAWKRWLLVGVVLVVTVVSTFVFADIVQSLVADARISFNVTNFFSLNNYSFIGFIVLAAMALSYFFFTQIILRLIRVNIRRGSMAIYIIIAFTGLSVLSFSRDTAKVELNIYVLIWLLLYVWIMLRNLFSGLNYRLNVSEVLFWLFVFSISMSVIIIFENRKIELDQRRIFADRIAEQLDPTSEKLVSMSLISFDNDFLFENFNRFKENGVNQYLKDSLISSNFIGYINKYDTKIYTYDSAEKPLHNQDSVSFDVLNTIFKLQGKPTTIADLEYYEKSFDKFTYIYKKTIQAAGKKPIGYLFMLAEPRNYKISGLAPQLTQQKKEYLPEYSPVYSYAIYNNKSLVYYYNNYPFPTELSDSIIPKTDFYQRKQGSFDELWHSITDDKIIVVAKKDNSLIEAITLFAWIFSAFLVLVALFWFASVLIHTRLHWNQLKTFLQLNIRSQIHTTIIFVSLFLFIVIGVATIFFLINRYNRNNQDRLSHSLKVMVKEIQDKLPNLTASNDSTSLESIVPKDQLERFIDNIAEIHGNDINLYNLQGSLIVSSNPFVYTKGMLSDQMQPLAYYYMHQLNSVEFFNNEKMGRISYQSIYCPVRIGNGSACAYLNVPSFSTEDELNDEISKFLVTIINLNVFIFLIAGTIALFLTNRITSSFTLISEKMRQVNLSKTNELVVWKNKDEIGGLITEYNKMVEKLDESAAALAKSEREGAWREMARQVAHEIKNPLTPMKLSIQYLQKAINNNSGNVKELTSNVARTLVEQIDHLSKIAADFSQFANIGNPKNEVFDLHEMLYSLTSLYETTENLLFKWVPVHPKIMVYADKTQLNRLFTNLLQNALEACHGRDKCVISVSEEFKEDTILVKVTDNGEGIPDSMHSKIFMPNFTTKSSGTGLGLAMSKTIVEQAKGKIWFETEVGKGTTFFVELPVLKVQQS
ncbi:MAG: HAMP domain-containing histidine kinase [Bacteroidetes bacterium]|nr:HAMP domain-containing histidine kinase [Bacteroidota bacterium]